MPLSDVLYQDGPQQYVQRAMRSGRLPHALIFAGPDGVGKQMFAERLATLLLCKSAAEKEGAIDACGACPSCVLSGAGTHPDYHVVYRKLNKYHPNPTIRNRKATQLSIDVIRHFLIAPVGMRPSHAEHKVFVIQEAERMNVEAQNAMLKTLEEPPNNSHLILIARSADSLLETIRSRCQIVRFGALPTEFVRKKLTESRRELNGPQSQFLAEMAAGSIGQADWLASVGIHEQVDDAAGIILDARRDPVAAGASASNAAKAIAEKIKSDDDVESGPDTNVARLGQTTQIALFSALLRESLRVAVGMAPSAYLPDRIRRIASQSTPAKLASAIRALNTADFHVGRSVNASLIFDSVGITLRRAFTPQNAAGAIGR